MAYLKTDLICIINMAKKIDIKFAIEVVIIKKNNINIEIIQVK